MKIKHYLAASALAVSAAFVLVSPGAQATDGLNDCPATDTDPAGDNASVQIDGVGGVCAEQSGADANGAPIGHVWADGDDGSPASGYISIANDDASDRDGVCADDHDGPARDDEDGDGNHIDPDVDDPSTPENEAESPTCAPDVTP